MRHIIVQVPEGHGSAISKWARLHRATQVACSEATVEGGLRDVVTANIPNGELGPFLEVMEKQAQGETLISFAPQGILALRPSGGEVPDEVTDVGARSPIEVYLGGLQSVGSWTSFLNYAVAAGIVAWIGLYTNTVFLLVGAMLIAPFASPAMVMAMATARGDARLVLQSLTRYGAGLATTALTAWALSFVARQNGASTMMIENSLVSSVAVLLPLTAGAAGALTLIQSQRDSLISGAATGVLVSASLAPPAGLVGMAAAIGEWEMVQSGLFVLLLQLAGINLSGALVFRWAGISPHGTLYGRGRLSASRIAWGMSLLAMALLLVWQFGDRPELRQLSQQQRAAHEVKEAVKESGLGMPIEVSARFTRAGSAASHNLLIVAYIERAPGNTLSDVETAETLRRGIQRRFEQHEVSGRPLVSVNLLHSPKADGEFRGAG